MPGITTAFAEGVAASRPAASSSNAGYMWYSTDTQILSQSNGSSWTQIAAGVALDLLSAKGDLLTRTSSAYARLGVGSDAQVLTADSAQSTGVKWATPASGFADPMTTAGDLIIRNGSNASTRLGIGSSSQVLTVSGGVPAWAAAAAASLTTASAYLGSNTTLTLNTMTDMVTVSLAAGTWLLQGWATFTTTNGGGGQFTLRLWDGTTTTSSTEQAVTAGGWVMQAALGALVVPGSTTTYRLATQANNGTATIYATTPMAGGGATATGLLALKVA